MSDRLHQLLRDIELARFEPHTPRPEPSRWLDARAALQNYLEEHTLTNVEADLVLRGKSTVEIRRKLIDLAGTVHCPECKHLAQWNLNGVFECRNQGCINFPYMTAQNAGKFEKMK